MSRIPRPLARRLDRLARAAHAFHRFAHHPLCEEYAGEVIRVGRRMRLCRGCTYVGAGLLFGTIGSFLLALPGGATLSVAAVTSVLAGVELGRNRQDAKNAKTRQELLLARLGALASWRLGRFKTIARLVPSVALGLAFGAGVRSANIAGALTALAAVATVGGLAMLYRRRGPDRTPCTTCPEFERAPSCRGFSEMVRRERAFVRFSGRMLALMPSPPPIPSPARAGPL